MAYCEVRHLFTYGQEIFFKKFSRCGANEPCTFASADTLTVTQSYDFNVGVCLAKREIDDGIVKRDDAAIDVLKSSYSLVFD